MAPFPDPVDAADLQLTTGDLTTGEFDVTIAYYTTDWQREVAKQIPTLLHMTSAQRAAALRDGVDVVYDRPVPKRVCKIRIVVSDAHSGAVGVADRSSGRSVAGLKL